MMPPIPVTSTIFLDSDEISEEFIHSSGPGGQNVNKVATAVRLRFNVIDSTSLPEEIKGRLARLAGKRMNAQGELVIEARQYRTQEQNRQAAQERLVHLIRAAAEHPKRRQKTHPTLASKQRRLKMKKQRSELKRLRSSIPED